MLIPLAADVNGVEKRSTTLLSKLILKIGKLSHGSVAGLLELLLIWSWLLWKA